MYEKRVLSNIKDNVYDNLIEYLLETCNRVRFTNRTFGLKKEERKMLFETEKYIKENFLDDLIIKDREIEDMLNYNNYDEYFRSYYIKVTPKLKKYLLSNKNIYAWLNPMYPEDMAFYKDNYCILQSITHEKLCFIYCERKEDFKKYEDMGIQFMKQYLFKEKSSLYIDSYKEPY